MFNKSLAKERCPYCFFNVEAASHKNAEDNLFLKLFPKCPICEKRYTTDKYGNTQKISDFIAGRGFALLVILILLIIIGLGYK